jgi:RNA ligase (TIGR02306 family)
MRKLASIQKILALEPIEGADAILKATVLGWQLVVKKDEFQVGDLCVYCEVDCIMPDRPEFEFLRPRGMRIRTIRLRGQISQGICLPISILPTDFEVVEDAECTEALGIRQYEPPALPAALSGKARGFFPSFIPKTDETRVQILQDLLTRYKGKRAYIAEKLDGSSATFFIKDSVFGVCSRNLELLEDDTNAFWEAARTLEIENKLRALGGNFALQGELVGEGIQGNKLKLKGRTVFFFNLFDIDKFQHLAYEDFKSKIAAMGLQTVPILDENYELEDNIPTLIQKATIKSAFNPAVWAEGIVIRLVEHPQNHQVSFKAISPEFLLKFGE